VERPGNFQFLGNFASIFPRAIHATPARRRKKKKVAAWIFSLHAQTSRINPAPTTPPPPRTGSFAMPGGLPITQSAFVGRERTPRSRLRRTAVLLREHHAVGVANANVPFDSRGRRRRFVQRGLQNSKKRDADAEDVDAVSQLHL